MMEVFLVIESNLLAIKFNEYWFTPKTHRDFGSIRFKK